MHIGLKWAGWSLLWSFGAVLLVLLGYYLATVNVLYPGSVQTPFDKLLFYVIPINLQWLIIIEIGVAILATGALEYSKNMLSKNREAIKAWKKSTEIKTEENDDYQL